MNVTITQQYYHYLLSIGVDLERLLEEAQLPDLTWKEKMNFSVRAYHQLLVAFDKRLSDEQIIGVSNLQQIHLFMPSFFAALSAKNGMEALKSFAKYKKLVGPVIVDMQEFGELVRVQFRFDSADEELPRFAVLNEQLLLVSLLRTGTGMPVVPVQVVSPFEYGAVIAEQFGVEPQQALENELVFAREDLERPFITANNVMLEYLEPQLKQRLSEVVTAETFSGQVQKKLWKMIPSGNFTVEVVAEELGVSVRTLQRKLQLENTTFKEVLQSAQKFMAIQYMREKQLSAEEIAFLVGYSEVSSFARAFKRWTGQTVGEYRQQLQ